MERTAIVEAKRQKNLSNEKEMDEFEWGTKEWFEQKITDRTIRPSSYFGHSKSGHQQLRHANIIKNLKKVVDPHDGLLILDIGCALGDLGKKVQDSFPGSKIIGIDFILELVFSASHSHRDISFAAAKLPLLPFKDSIFDLVIASEVIYYLDDVERIKALENIARLLKKNGLFLFTSALDNINRRFTRSSAIKYIEGRMVTIINSFEYGLLYRFFLKAAKKGIRLCEKYSGRTNYRGIQQEMLNFNLCSIMAIISLVPKKFLIGIQNIIEFLLSKKEIPALLAWISQKLLGDRAITSILIISRK